MENSYSKLHKVDAVFFEFQEAANCANGSMGNSKEAKAVRDMLENILKKELEKPGYCAELKKELIKSVWIQRRLRKNIILFNLEPYYLEVVRENSDGKNSINMRHVDPKYSRYLKVIFDEATATVTLGLDGSPVVVSTRGDNMPSVASRALAWSTALVFTSPRSMRRNRRR